LIESGARRNVFGVKTLQNNDMYIFNENATGMCIFLKIKNARMLSLEEIFTESFAGAAATPFLQQGGSAPFGSSSARSGGVS
jgi:hypothetical protein